MMTYITNSWKKEQICVRSEIGHIDLIADICRF